MYVPTIAVVVPVAVDVDVGDADPEEEECSTLSTELKYELTAAFVLLTPLETLLAIELAEEEALRTGPPGVTEVNADDGATVSVEVETPEVAVVTDIGVEVDEEEGEGDK